MSDGALTSDNESRRNDLMKHVPSLGHYGAAYLGGDLQRVHSYRQQVIYALETHPQRVLLVGKGDGYVATLLSQAGVDVMTLDIAANLAPDIVGSVDAIPYRGEPFDVSVCCQVLEHLPFARFVPALEELRRVTRSRLVLSLPDVRRFASLRLRIGRRSVGYQMSMEHRRRVQIPEKMLADFGHYWEVGYLGTECRIVKQRIREAGWQILDHRRVDDHPWHAFFYCRPADGLSGEQSVWRP